ncbi:hypothetical protein L198_05878 [Cryptococcus wingfieldii CBS 7118]|uniref:Uncharacterized protein n=1 Tax=Cryptococcus wingfieldii CBS 7118 TaxID=1295528 RepID=A0A1E3IRY3_9TREE|nr:hypothetical protein L198_05878 [Cryptococcus wingfieldii CBS 7118]ODN91367.1 hypothetical protein L198_05878 [Cryptococcus wingfieldii CBS 7118]
MSHTHGPAPNATFPAIIWHPSFAPGQQGQGGKSNGAGQVDSSNVLRPWAPAGDGTQGATKDVSSLSLSNNQQNPPAYYVAYPELTCLHCLGANPPGKLGYVVSYVPADAQGNPLPPNSSSSSTKGTTQALPNGSGSNVNFPSTTSALGDDRRGRGRGADQGQERRQRSTSAFRAGEILGGKSYVPDEGEEDQVGDIE